MAIKHLNANEIGDINLSKESSLTKKTTALFKSKDLELIRLVLNKGESLPEHKVKGEIIIQCIEGNLNVLINGQSYILKEGKLMFLLGDQMHSVLAITNSVALVTIALK